MLRPVVVLAGLSLTVPAACAAADESAGAPAAAQPAGSTGVAGLPHAQGRVFASLDEYLAHLERRGAYDVPYYREVRPGVYELVAGRRAAGQSPQTFTRRQLAEKFGFPE